MDTLFIGSLYWHLLPQPKPLSLLAALFVCCLKAHIHAGSSEKMHLCCLPNSFAYPASSVSFCLSTIFCVLFLSDPFLDLWDLLLLVVMVGLGSRVMQLWDYSSGLIDSDRLNNQYMHGRFRGKHMQHFILFQKLEANHSMACSKAFGYIFLFFLKSVQSLYMQGQISGSCCISLLWPRSKALKGFQ